MNEWITSIGIECIVAQFLALAAGGLTDGATYNVQSVKTNERNSGAIKSTKTRSVRHFPTIANKRLDLNTLSISTVNKVLFTSNVTVVTAQRLAFRWQPNDTPNKTFLPNVSTGVIC